MKILVGIIRCSINLVVDLVLHLFTLTTHNSMFLFSNSTTSVLPALLQSWTISDKWHSNWSLRQELKYLVFLFINRLMTDNRKSYWLHNKIIYIEFLWKKERRSQRWKNQLLWQKMVDSLFVYSYKLSNHLLIDFLDNWCWIFADDFLPRSTFVSRIILLALNLLILIIFFYLLS
jgi:hypothetical protein